MQLRAVTNILHPGEVGFQSLDKQTSFVLGGVQGVPPLFFEAYHSQLILLFHTEKHRDHCGSGFEGDEGVGIMGKPFGSDRPILKSLWVGRIENFLGSTEPFIVQTTEVLSQTKESRDFLREFILKHYRAFEKIGVCLGVESVLTEAQRCLLEYGHFHFGRVTGGGIKTSSSLLSVLLELGVTRAELESFAPVLLEFVPEFFADIVEQERRLQSEIQAAADAATAAQAAYEMKLRETAPSLDALQELQRLRVASGWVDLVPETSTPEK